MKRMREREREREERKELSTKKKHDGVEGSGWVGDSCLHGWMWLSL